MKNYVGVIIIVYKSFAYYGYCFIIYEGIWILKSLRQVYRIWAKPSSSKFWFFGSSFKILLN